MFEKVNTGGKALDAFELITAMFAGKGFKLREDWAQRAAALRKFRALEKIAPTDFLQGIALLHSKAQREAAASEDRRPPVSATRNALLALPVEAYQANADRLQLGFERAPSSCTHSGSTARSTCPTRARSSRWLQSSRRSATDGSTSSQAAGPHVVLVRRVR